jgi:putative heme-binding domain-containing protein
MEIHKAKPVHYWREFLKRLGMMVMGIGVAVAAPAAAQDHQYSAEQIQAGYRIYVGQCQLCHGFNGDGIARVSLSRQQFPRAVTDDDIRKAIATGNPAGMPPFALKAEELDGLVAFIRSGMDQAGTGFRLGDAVHGKTVYEIAGCSTCHRLDGKGPRTAPALDDIGFARRPWQIMTSLTDPTKGTMPINRPVTIVMTDGRTIHGRRFNEDTFSVQLIDQQEKVQSIQKSAIRRYDVGMTSQMPSYRGRLNDADLADLLAYLVSLRGK